MPLHLIYSIADEQKFALFWFFDLNGRLKFQKWPFCFTCYAVFLGLSSQFLFSNKLVIHKPRSSIFVCFERSTLRLRFIKGIYVQALFFQKKSKRKLSVKSSLPAWVILGWSVWRNRFISWQLHFSVFLAGSDTLTVWRLIPGFINNENFCQREKLKGESH